MREINRRACIDPRELKSSIGCVRRFYRNHLAGYVAICWLKIVHLACWRPLQNIFVALGLLRKPRIFYRSYLARYWLFRQIKDGLLWVYFINPLALTRLRLFLFTKNCTYRLLTMSEFVKERKFDKILIEPESSLAIPGPRFIGKYPITLHSVDTVYLPMPPIEVVEIPRAMVMGGTNLILSGDIAIHPDLLDFGCDVIPAEIFGVAKLDLQNKRIRILESRKVAKTDFAISMLGQCTGNYAHWLTETLPKLLIINEISAYDQLPLLVDQWIHPNFYRSIKLLDKKNRKHIYLSRWETLMLAKVIELSPPAYVPYEGRDSKITAYPEPNKNNCIFSKFALDKLRTAALSAQSGKKSLAFKKLYLARPKQSVGNGKLIDNVFAVERLVMSYGFQFIDTGKLSFDEQIEIFSEAECIVAPVGAALANTIFTRPGCQIIALSPFYENANYYYFSNLMHVLGHELHYVLGPQIEAAGHIAHRNYSVNLDALSEALDRLES